MQLDEEGRGFSFKKNGPLDMRMDTTSSITAKDVVNSMSEKDLGAIFRDFGEEKLWRRVAHAIVEARRKKHLETTGELKDVVNKVLPFNGGKINPATKIFQAIRIYINKELETIEGSLKKAIDILAPGGKIGVLSFHSLEDRIVKNVFRDASKPLKNLHGKIVREAIIKTLTKKPIIPSMIEMRKNRRARSAKLRFAVKIEHSAIL